uniref:Uncharacterized protein n=1 Tax=Anopheles coluzzii TaxID=1518534 RepID=A0A8W7PHW7_ANOCL
MLMLIATAIVAKPIERERRSEAKFWDYDDSVAGMNTAFYLNDNETQRSAGSTRHGAQLEVTKSIADNGNTPRLYATKIGTERKRRAPKISSRAPEVVCTPKLSLSTRNAGCKQQKRIHIEMMFMKHLHRKSDSLAGLGSLMVVLSKSAAQYG